MHLQLQQMMIKGFVHGANSYLVDKKIGVYLAGLEKRDQV